MDIKLPNSFYPSLYNLYQFLEYSVFLNELLNNEFSI